MKPSILISSLMLVSGVLAGCGGGRDRSNVDPPHRPPPASSGRVPPPAGPVPPPAPTPMRVAVQGHAAVVDEGEAAVFDVRLSGGAEGATREVSLEVARTLGRQPLAADQNSQLIDLFAPGEYIANGTVFTRSVADMPLAPNSAAITEYARRMPGQYQKMVVTGLNWKYYNIPIYVVDSSDSGQAHARFHSDDNRVKYFPDIIANTTGQVAFPSYAAPNPKGDYSLAVYDRGSGLFREYFYVHRQPDGHWRFAASGFYQARPGLQGLAADNYWMQLTRGSSAVVGMLNPLSQIGISEALSGQINHALSVTLPNARAGVHSFPARQSDGSDPNPNAPAEGQWFRIDPKVDLDVLGLRPFTLMIAKAIQKYGGYGADKNHWSFAFNTEPGVNWVAAGKPDPWEEGGAIANKYGDLNVNDFPWHLVQWARMDWNGKGADAGVYLDQNIVVTIAGKPRTLGRQGGRFSLPAGVGRFQVTVPTAALNQLQQIESVGLTVEAADTRGGSASARSQVRVLDAAVKQRHHLANRGG